MPQCCGTGQHSLGRSVSTKVWMVSTVTLECAVTAVSDRQRPSLCSHVTLQFGSHEWFSMATSGRRVRGSEQREALRRGRGRQARNHGSIAASRCTSEPAPPEASLGTPGKASTRRARRISPAAVSRAALRSVSCTFMPQYDGEVDPNTPQSYGNSRASKANPNQGARSGADQWM